MPVDTETFRRYAKIVQHIHDNFDGGISEERLRELIGVEFDIISPSPIERHFRNIIQARLITAGTNGMRATVIDWVEFEEKLKIKERELAEKNVKNSVS